MVVGVSAWPVMLVVFLLGFVNFLTSDANNWNISFLQLAFCLGSFLILRGRFFGLGFYGVGVLLVCFSFVVSNFLAEQDGVALADWRRVFGMVVHFVFAVCFFYWFSNWPGVLHGVVSSLLLAVVVYFMVLSGFWLYLEDPYAHDWLSDPPLFRNIRHLGYLLCAGMVISSWGGMVYSGGRRLLAWCVYLLAVSMLLWSGSRGAFIAACGGLLVLMVRFPLRQYLHRWGGLLLALLLAFVFSAVFDVGKSGMGWLSAVLRSVEASSLEQFGSSRISIWKYLLEKIAERPWFGWGGEGFSSVWETSYIVQAHNGVLQLLVEWGVVGALLVACLLGWVTVKGGMVYWGKASKLPVDDPLIPGMALVAALLLLSLVDGIFYHGTPLAFLMIAYGMVGTALRTSGPEKAA